MICQSLYLNRVKASTLSKTRGAGMGRFLSEGETMDIKFKILQAARKETHFEHAPNFDENEDQDLWMTQYAVNVYALLDKEIKAELLSDFVYETNKTPFDDQDQQLSFSWGEDFKEFLLSSMKETLTNHMAEQKAEFINNAYDHTDV